MQPSDLIRAVNQGIAKLDQNPDHVPTLLEMGSLMLDLKRWDAATLQFRHALRADPDSSHVRQMLKKAAAYMVRLGQVDNGRILYLSLMVQYPEDRDIEQAWAAMSDSDEAKSIAEHSFARQSDYRVSAIISTYCSADFISDCLENLLRQTIADSMEIVVVDAASPEPEREIVFRYARRNQNITYLRTRARIGIYPAWNIAISQATGRYCISISTNDQLNENACEILADTLDLNPNVALAFGDTYLTRYPHETFHQNSHHAVYRWGKYSFDQHLRDGCCIGPHPMWRRGVHAAVGYFDERFVAVGDQEFWLRLGSVYPIAHVSQFTGLQWITPDSLSGAGDIPALELKYIQGKYKAAGRLSHAPIRQAQP